MKEKQLHNRKSPRLKCWDYSDPHWYFVTICTDNHTEYFGSIEKEKMAPNNLGEFVETCWNDIPRHYKNVELDYYVVMPNHIHGIIIINPPDKSNDQINTVGLRHASTLREITLGNIIGSFKSAVTKWTTRNDYKNFKWQRSFYDRIIRNEKELFRIRRYIHYNPLKWDIEKNVSENLDI